MEGLHIQFEDLHISVPSLEQADQVQYTFLDDGDFNQELPVIEPYQDYEDLADYEANDQSLEGETDWKTDSSDSSEGSTESDDTVTQLFKEFGIDTSSAGPPPSRRAGPRA